MGELKTRVSKRLREAIRLMVEDALTRAEAAERVGMTDHGLYVALRKPHVLALRAQILGDLRGSAASRTIARAEKLADNAESEHVRNDANQWLASLDPATAPVQRSEATVEHRVLGPGLVIVFAPRAAEATTQITNPPAARLDSNLRPLVPFPWDTKKEIADE